MMTRSFTTREKILMLCLAVVILAAVYMKVVYIDVSNTMEQYPALLAEAEEELSLEQQKYGKLQAMRRELDAVKESGAELQEVPDYDNSKRIMEELNQILRPCKNYSLNFLPLEQEGNIIRRKIDLQFTCSNYGTAEQVVLDIDEMQYRCLITSLSMQGRDTVKTGEVTTRLEATFFELSEEVIVAQKETE